MAKTQEIDVKIKAILDAGPSIAGLKELKKLQKETIAGSEGFRASAAAIRDFGDAIEESKSGADDFLGKLENAGGPLGMLGKGIRQAEITFSSFNNILKASVIGLLVAAIGGMVAAFSKSETAVKKLQPLMIGLEKILGGIFRAMEPLLDIFIELAMEALPFITKGIGMFYSGLFSLFTLVKNVGVSVGKILKGVFTLDFDSLKEGAAGIKDAFTSVGKTFEDTYNRFEEGTKEQTKTEKENAEERAKILAAEAEKRKKVVDEINAYVAKGVESRGKTQQEELSDAKKVYDNLLVQAKKYGIDTARITTAYNEQVAKINKTFSDKAKEEEQKDFDLKLKKQLDGDKLILDQLRANFEQSKVIYGENSMEARKAQDDIFKAQEQGLKNEQLLLEGKKQLTDAEKLRLEQIKLDQQNLTTTIVAENQKRLKSDLDTALKSAEANKKATDDLFAENMRKSEGDLIAQQSLLDEKKRLDEQYYAEQLAREGLTAEQIKAIKDKQTADAKANAEAQITIEQKKFQAQQALLQATGAAVMALADIVGKNTVAGKALAVAASLINTYTAIAGQLAAFAGVPVPGYAIVQAVATGLVGFKAVADIVKTKVPSTSGGGETTGTSVQTPRALASGGMVIGPGGGKSDLIPAMLSNGESVINAQSTSMFRPLLSSINAIGGGRRFAEGGLAVSGMGQDQALQQLQSMMNTQQSPIKTYVVASDMTSQQMLDRNIKDRSTL